MLLGHPFHRPMAYWKTRPAYTSGVNRNPASTPRGTNPWKKSETATGDDPGGAPVKCPNGKLKTVRKASAGPDSPARAVTGRDRATAAINNCDFSVSPSAGLSPDG